MLVGVHFWFYVSWAKWLKALDREFVEGKIERILTTNWQLYRFRIRRCNMLKKIVILLMGVLVFGIGSIAPGKVWGDIVKIGAIWELTGPGASWGLPCKKMVDFQAYEVNTRGGINIAGKKYLVEFITEDGKCTAADGVTSAKKLVFRDKVKHIVGPVCSASCAAIVPIIEENKVLMMTVSCGTDKFFSSKTKYAFRTYPPGYPLIPAFLGWAVDKRKDLKKVLSRN